MASDAPFRKSISEGGEFPLKEKRSVMKTNVTYNYSIDLIMNMLLIHRKNLESENFRNKLKYEKLF